MIVWVIGLSGAGKTTIGRAIYERMRRDRDNVVLLDGDQVRAVMGEDLGHSLEDRRANGDRIQALCKVLDDQGIHVVCCILSLFEAHRAWNREHFSSYLEVFVDVPLEVLVERDPKGLYAGARAGEIENVVGVDLPFERPRAPDVVVDNTPPLEAPGVIAERVLEGAGWPEVA